MRGSIRGIPPRQSAWKGRDRPRALGALLAASALAASVVVVPTGLAAGQAVGPADVEGRVTQLLGRMTLAEKIGQLTLRQAADNGIPAELRQAIKEGAVGGVLNQVDPATIREMQRVAVEETRLGIPLLVGRDVLHGFRTVFPIPLGQAASWDPALIRQAARFAGREAASVGVNWTFAPVVDIARDPRWGRIAESLGEDPYLTSVLGVAMVEGFQGNDLSRPGNVAACAKHFVAYGAAVGGRDYNSADVPSRELHNVYLPPFRAAVNAGAASVMVALNDIDGVPAAANRFLASGVLRDEWGFRGLVVSDWNAIAELTVYGVAGTEKDAAYQALSAGVDMEMESALYRNRLPELLREGRLKPAQIDAAVRDVLRVKFRLGLFDGPVPRPPPTVAGPDPQGLGLARQLALESLVLLQNHGKVLPLSKSGLRSLAVVGPMADDPYEQLGTWIYDGDVARSRTPLASLREFLGDRVAVHYVRALPTTRSRTTDGFAAAIAAVRQADAVVAFLGEESILSGENHSRADIDLPGSQVALLRALHATGKPVIAVILAGRPLTLLDVVDQADAILYAWHPGSMAGPAITDVLFGVQSPSGKLPVTFPKVVGQVPIYYAHSNTGHPPAPNPVGIDDIPVRAVQYSLPYMSYLDVGNDPLFPFGFGLSYATFSYGDIEVSAGLITADEPITISARVTNTGTVAADEVAQLYIRDRVGSIARPVRELKGFRRLHLAPGESRRVSFTLQPGALSFYGRDMQQKTEPGDFDAWIGGSSEATLHAEFRIIQAGRHGGTSP